eukprot:UN02902
MVSLAFLVLQDAEATTQTKQHALQLLLDLFASIPTISRELAGQIGQSQIANILRPFSQKGRGEIKKLATSCMTELSKLSRQ